MASSTKTETRTEHGVPAAATDRGDASMVRAEGKASAGSRLGVNKAYKMYVGGAFVRSESGRYFQVKTNGAPLEAHDADPDVVNIPRGSRKDVRDAVLVAKN